MRVVRLCTLHASTRLADKEKCNDEQADLQSLRASQHGKVAKHCCTLSSAILGQRWALYSACNDRRMPCRVTAVMAGVSAKDLRPAAHGTARQAEACLRAELAKVEGKQDRHSRAARAMCTQALVEEVLLKQDRVADAEAITQQHEADMESEVYEVRAPSVWAVSCCVWLLLSCLTVTRHYRRCERPLHCKVPCMWLLLPASLCRLVAVMAEARPLLLQHAVHQAESALVQAHSSW